MPKSKGRVKKKQSRTRAGGAQIPQVSSASTKRMSYRKRRNRRVGGWVLVSIGTFVGITHWFSHLGFLHIASPAVQDLAIGYPMAVLLIVVGAMLIPAN